MLYCYHMSIAPQYQYCAWETWVFLFLIKCEIVMVLVLMYDSGYLLKKHGVESLWDRVGQSMIHMSPSIVENYLCSPWPTSYRGKTFTSGSFQLWRTMHVIAPVRATMKYTILRYYAYRKTSSGRNYVSNSEILHLRMFFCSSRY